MYVRTYVLMYVCVYVCMYVNMYGENTKFCDITNLPNVQLEDFLDLSTTKKITELYFYCSLSLLHVRISAGEWEEGGFPLFWKITYTFKYLRKLKNNNNNKKKLKIIFK